MVSTVGNGNIDLRDLLTAYDGNTITHDAIGNPLNDGKWTYTWEHGRELASMSRSSYNTWTFAYDANGMRTRRTHSEIEYLYVYNGSQLTQMTVLETGGGALATNTLYFTYSADGTPLTVTSEGETYFYVTNIQGDVIAILDDTGRVVCRYIYDAWGNVTTDAWLSDIVIDHNPLRYRGYVYDQETQLYYLQSRYYNPKIGRFLNADSVMSGTGGDVLGNNMFAYCFNNPVNMSDSSGNWPKLANLTKGAGWLAVGITAVCVGLSVITCGVAAPAMMAVATVTIGAGALTAVNGAAEIGEAFTDYNVVRDTVFNGNQSAYDVYANTTAAVAEIGTAICGSWSAKNAPRIKAYESMDTYNVKDKHLPTTTGDWNKFNTDSQSVLQDLGREIIKNTSMDSLLPNSPDSYKVVYDFGRVIGNRGETCARLVFSEMGKIITFFPQ